MNDYFPLLLVFGFVITFVIFVIMLFSPKKSFNEIENFEEKIKDWDEMAELTDLVNQLKKENLELKRSLNKYYNEDELNDRY